MKIVRNIFGNTVLIGVSLQPLRERNTSQKHNKNGSEKDFENLSQKIWWLQKKALPLHHFR